eukprot:Sdes_comp20431_c0_seq4m14578
MIFSLRDSWHSKKGSSAVISMKEYIECVTELDPNWRACLKSAEKDEKPAQSEEKQNGLAKKPSSAFNFGGKVFSRFNVEPETLADKQAAPTIFDFCKQDSVLELSKLYESRPELFSVADEDGIYPLHWICDSASRESLVFFLALPKPFVDINCRDSEGMTPLHYAVLCGHVEIAQMLVEAGADVRSFDHQGKKPFDLIDALEISRWKCFVDQ